MPLRNFHNNIPTSSSSSSSSSSSLRRLSTPFLMTYHPDHYSACSSSPHAQQINLHAIQTLNGLIDTIESIYQRAASSSSSSPLSSNSKKIELDTKHQIEFIKINSSTEPLPGQTKQPSSFSTSKTTYGRRSVELTFSSEIINDALRVNPHGGGYSFDAAKRLKYAMGQEIVKLLRIAGLEIPKASSLDYPWMEEQEKEEEPYDATNAILDQLGMTPEYFKDMERRAQEGNAHLFDDKGRLKDNHQHHQAQHHHNRRWSQKAKKEAKKKTPYEKSRDRFMKNFNWKKYHELKRKEEEEERRRELTKGLIENNPERKRFMVEDLLSRVYVDPNYGRIPTNQQQEHEQDSYNYQDQQNEEDEDDPDNSDGLDPINQLITIRRLHLILLHNFSELRMEELCSIYENTTIILTPSRQYIRKHRDKFIVPKKRKNQPKDSGYAFSFQSDESILLHVPVDFGNEEVVNELKVGLGEYHDSFESEKMMLDPDMMMMMMMKK